MLDDEEYKRLVEEKMKARAERNARQQQAERETTEQAAREEREAKDRAEEEKRRKAERELEHDKKLKAEREVRQKLQRLKLVQKYKAAPQGIRTVEALQSICIECNSDNVRDRSPSEHHFKVCLDCNAQWYVNHCWSCGSGLVDSRDPDTPQCSVCGWYKCAVCGACKLDGCSTNPYNREHRFRDVKESS
jgi:hypothetical protein